jgi:sterol 3beta-glucosyltransferase
MINMKIAITTVGSRGDLQPFIALGLGLKKTGHQVLIISAKNEENFVKDYGLDFCALDVDIQELMEGKDVQEMSKGKNPIKFITSHLKGSRNMKELMIKTQADIWKACNGFDLIIFHTGMPIGFFKAKVENLKSVMLNPFPVVSTPDYPSILFYTLPKLGKVFNRLTHKIFYKVFWALTKSAIQEFWQKEVEKKVNFSTSPIKQQIMSGQPVINAYSSFLFKPYEKWNENIHTTGSLLIENENKYKPEFELEKFLSNGEAPIFIGFGSMRELGEFSKTIKIIEDVAKVTGQRFIVGLGWTKNSYDKPISNSILLIESIPFGWLFPKTKMVIHHGGAGTTAIGLISGKPTTIIPHNADQPAWGKRIYELGLGAKPIPKKSLSSEKLANAIKYSLQPDIVKNAIEIGEKMRNENGLEKAVKIINDYIKE